MKKLTLFLFVLVACVFGYSESYAFSLGDITRPLMDGMKRLDPTLPGSATSPIRKYKIVISNSTNRGIHYRFDGQPELLSSHQATTWTVKHTSTTRPVSFNNGNNQTITYDVGSGRYTFRWGNGVLQLYRD